MIIGVDFLRAHLSSLETSRGIIRVVEGVRGVVLRIWKKWGLDVSFFGFGYLGEQDTSHIPPVITLLPHNNPDRQDRN